LKARTGVREDFQHANKGIVGRWFTEFWGSTWNPGIVDELCTSDILLQYSLHAPRRGRADVKEEGHD
jgi:hypothetical protein